MGNTVISPFPITGKPSETVCIWNELELIF